MHVVMCIGRQKEKIRKPSKMKWRNPWVTISARRNIDTGKAF